MRRMRRAALTLVVMIASVVALRAQQQKPNATFRATVDLVNFGVSVVDKQGNPVIGLTQEDFEILESGKKQSVQFFSAGSLETAPPLHIGLLLDTSGSMADDLKDARSSAIKFVNTLDHNALLDRR